MMDILYLILGITIAAIGMWITSRQNSKKLSTTTARINSLQTELQLSNTQVASLSEAKSILEKNLEKSEQSLSTKNEELRSFEATVASLQSELRTAGQALQNTCSEKGKISTELEDSKQSMSKLEKQIAQLSVEKEGVNKELNKLSDVLSDSEDKLKLKTQEYNTANEKVAALTANNNALGEKLETQRKEIEELQNKFKSDFEIIASQVLEAKTEKFTATNKTNIEGLLNPFAEKLKDLKTRVEQLYADENKERFSLGEKIQELVNLNNKLSKEAHDLTLALKADPKAQGNWGEMILESILEQSGLTKNREYFLENYLKDDNGEYIINEEGKKMRPDAIIQYPDERKVIIDSKVSLVAYTRFLNTDEADEQEQHILKHLADIKQHIVSLSKRGYENFDKSLDFVMMFIPNEPAYMLAVKKDPNLWSFAYDLRIILISPTNLITALKLISNLWDKDYQNQNAQAIVERGEKLYNKFVGFAENFTAVGTKLNAAQQSYETSFKQLTTGRDNLVRQALKLKELRINPKKNFPSEMLEGNQIEQEIDQE